jgi:hypothetical protein
MIALSRRVVSRGAPPQSLRVLWHCGRGQVLKEEK